MTKKKDPKGKILEIRKRGELAVTEKSLGVSDLSALYPEKVQQLIHELQVHQAELEMQNEELRQTQLSLEESRSKYQDLYDFAPVGYVTVNEKGLILEANLTVEQLLGEDRQRLIKRPFSRCIRQEFRDDFYLCLKQFFETRSKQTCEINLVRKDGTDFYAQMAFVAVQDENGKYSRCRIIVLDITDRKKTEQALFEAKLDWEDTFNSINDSITIHDTDYNIIHYNTAAERLLGLPNLVTSDIIKCYQYYHGRDCPPETCPSCRCLQTQQQAVSEIFEPYLNMFVEITAIPRFNKDGQLTGVVHIVRDITERKISEELLRIRLNLLEFAASHSLNEFLQKTLDEVGILTNSPIGFYHLIGEDEKTITLQAWSTRTVKELCKVEGKGQHYPVDQGGVWVDCVHERKPVIHNDYSSLLHRKGMPEGHAPVIRELVAPIMRSDRIVAVLGIGNKPTDYTEKDIEIVSYLADIAWEITERKRAEEAVEESEQQYRTLFEESIDGVYSVLRDGEITDANPAFCALFGYVREEMIGKDIRDLYLDPTDRPRFQKEIEKTGFVKDYEIKFQNRDGIDLDCLITSSVLFEEDGSITGYRGIVRDLTARKELQKQLLQAQKMEAIGTLSGGIAHDFNNLLTIVMGFSELLLAEKDPKHPEYADLQKIFHAAKNGAELVQRLLMFSRKSDTKPVPMNLNKQIVQVEKLLRRTIPRMVDINLDLSADLPKIYGDPSQVEQVLMNLAVNARDAMPDGGKLTVRTSMLTLDEEYSRRHVEASPGHYLLLEVSDTGHGIDKETAKRIFEPFFTTKEMGRGTGLGLAMVHGIVGQHNGHITCHSEVGQGTTFRVYLPAIEGEVETDVEITLIMPAFGTETVLLVDDEEFVRELGARILTKHGYTVLQAVNGGEALDLFKKERSQISLVILDLIMPEMGGTECLKELLKIDPNLKVLVASGYSADASVKDTIQIGAKGFVTKPFRVNELLRDVRKVLDES